MRSPEAPTRASITIEASTKVAAETRRESAISIASLNARRSGSSWSMASSADVSMTISAASRFIVSEDLVRRPIVPHRQRGAFKSDLVEFVGEPMSRPLPAQSCEPVAQRARYCLRLGLAGELRDSLGEAFRLGIADVRRAPLLKRPLV